MLNSIDFGEFVTEKHFGSDIDFNAPLELQVKELSEDILQVRYSGSYCIDVGWYPEFDLNGHFVIVVTKDGNWEKPVKKAECYNLHDLFESINLCVEFVRGIVT